MENNTYLNWVISNTKTEWWHDSADLAELQIGLERGAVGVTTNPFLSNIAVQKCRANGLPGCRGDPGPEAYGEEKAEALMRLVVTRVAEKLMPEFEKTGGKSGFVCAQVNPSRAGERPEMFAMARRFNKWAPNIAVKLPCTAGWAGRARGLHRRRHHHHLHGQLHRAPGAGHRRAAPARASQRAQAEWDRARQVLRRHHDWPLGRLPEGSRPRQRRERQRIRHPQAGIAATKRAYQIYQAERLRGRAPRRRAARPLSPHGAGRRRPHHVHRSRARRAGSSTRTIRAKSGSTSEVPADVDREAPPDARVRQGIRTAMACSPKDFVTYGATQRTLSQFCEVGLETPRGLQVGLQRRVFIRWLRPLKCRSSATRSRSASSASGERIKEIKSLRGEIIAEIETDKATFELAAPVDGTLLGAFFEEGALVPVFTNICVIGNAR